MADHQDPLEIKKTGHQIVEKIDETLDPVIVALAPRNPKYLGFLPSEARQRLNQQFLIAIEKEIDQLPNEEKQLISEIFDQHNSYIKKCKGYKRQYSQLKTSDPKEKETIGEQLKEAYRNEWKQASESIKGKYRQLLKDRFVDDKPKQSKESKEPNRSNQTKHHNTIESKNPKNQSSHPKDSNNSKDSKNTKNLKGPKNSENKKGDRSEKDKRPDDSESNSSNESDQRLDSREKYQYSDESRADVTLIKDPRHRQDQRNQRHKQESNRKGPKHR